MIYFLILKILNFMNKFILNLILLLSFVSCVEVYQMDTSHDFSESICTNSVLTKSASIVQVEAYRLFEDAYIEFDPLERCYKMKITRKEAVERGYTAAGYDYLQDVLTHGNAWLQEEVFDTMETESSCYRDCTYDVFDGEPQIELIAIQTRQEQISYPSGSISSSLGYPATVSFYAPQGMGRISGSCFSNVALFAMHSVESNFGSKETAFRFGYGELSVGIGLSDRTGSLTYIVSDSNGGTYSWRGCGK